MKGLLIKDLKLMKNQYYFFSIIIIISAFIMIFTKDSSFVIGYLPFLSSMFVISTISYDQFDNGMSYLMILPVNKKEYSLEKYIFGIMIGIAGLLIAFTIAIIYQILVLQNLYIKELLLTSLFVFMFLIVLLSLLIPIELKFGGENARIVLLITIGCICIMGYSILKITEMMNMNLISYITFYLTFYLYRSLLIGFIISIGCLFVSFQSSCAILKNKEF